jgi:hypothetical protein
MSAELADPECPICTTGMKIPGCLVLDALQVTAAQQRWQWADLGPGANDCPCVQMKRKLAAEDVSS